MEHKVLIVAVVILALAVGVIGVIYANTAMTSMSGLLGQASELSPKIPAFEVEGVWCYSSPYYMYPDIDSAMRFGSEGDFRFVKRIVGENPTDCDIRGTYSSNSSGVFLNVTEVTGENCDSIDLSYGGLVFGPDGIIWGVVLDGYVYENDGSCHLSL